MADLLGMLVMAVRCGGGLLTTLRSFWVSLTDWIVVPRLLGAKDFQIQGWVLYVGLFFSRFKVLDQGEVGVGFDCLTTMVFQDNDIIIDGVLLKLNMDQLWFFYSGQISFLLNNKYE